MFQYPRHGSHISYTKANRLDKLIVNTPFNCFQVYFGGRLGWNRKSISSYEIERAISVFKETEKRMYVHACLSSHLASDNMSKKNGEPMPTHQCTREALEHELRIIKQLPSSSVIHPGSGGTIETFTERLNDIDIPSSDFNMQATLLLENSAGQGATLGRNWEEYRHILEHLDDTLNISVCIDTCHAYAAGMCIFDTADSVTKLFDDCYDLFGHNIPMIHLNGSKVESSIENPCNKDRHAPLMFSGIVPVKRKRKGEYVIIEEYHQDYIWRSPVYTGIKMAVAIAPANAGEEFDIGIYSILSGSKNFESLEELVRLSVDCDTDLISETGDSFTDNFIIGAIYSNLN